MKSPNVTQIGKQSAEAERRLASNRLLLCQLLTGASDGVAVANLSADDWRELARAAILDRVAPVLNHTFYQHGWPEGMPEDVRRRLRQARYRAAGRYVAASYTLGEVLELLAAPPAIPVVLLKGIALGLTLYPAPTLRPMSDLDLLVPVERVDEAVDRLRDHGWEDDVSAGMTPGLMQWMSHHISLAKRQNASLGVEIHRTLGDSVHERVPVDEAWFWQQTEVLLLENGVRDHGPSQVLALSPTANLLYLSAHWMRHRERSPRLVALMWLYDIHLLVAQEMGRIDWETAVGRAWDWSWNEALSTALHAVDEYFGTAFPDGVLTQLGPAGGMAPRAEFRLSRTARTLSCFSHLQGPAFIRLVLGVLFPRPAYVLCRYQPKPAWLWPLWYVWRWVDIGLDGVRTAVLAVKHGLTGR